MRSFRHLQAETIEGAVALLTKYRGKARVNAGGTDLLGVLKDEILPGYPQALIDIKTIAGLDTIREENEWLKIGALARLKDIAGSPLIRERYGVLAEAARSVGSLLRSATSPPWAGTSARRCAAGISATPVTWGAPYPVPAREKAPAWPSRATIATTPSWEERNASPSVPRIPP